MAAITFVFPGPVDTPTGGFRYDRRIVAEMSAAGREVDTVVVEGTWPWPAAGDLASADAVLAGLATGARVVVDGLALGAMPGLAVRHARRLRLVGLVHHPLWLEQASPEEEASGSTSDPGRARLRHDELTALAATRHVVVTSARTAGAVAAMGVPAARITVVEPGCDPFALARGTRRLQASTSPCDGQAPSRCDGQTPLRLICVATVTPRKGQLELVDALAATVQAGSPDADRWTLDLIGSTTRDATYVRSVQGRIEALGLRDRIRLLGEVAESDLPFHYDGADGMVLASRYEGYGMSLVEALMHGLPLVVTRGGAIADTVGDGARLVEPGDRDALARAIREALLDPSGRQALAARAQRWRDRNLAARSWRRAALRFADVIDAV